MDATESSGIAGNPGAVNIVAETGVLGVILVLDLRAVSGWVACASAMATI